MSIAALSGLSKNKLLINVNLHKSIFDNMKKGQIPSIDKIHLIANYLDCSVDYLLGRTDNPISHKAPAKIKNSSVSPSNNTERQAAYEFDDTSVLPKKKGKVITSD